LIAPEVRPVARDLLGRHRLVVVAAVFVLRLEGEVAADALGALGVEGELQRTVEGFEGSDRVAHQVGIAQVHDLRRRDRPRIAKLCHAVEQVRRLLADEQLGENRSVEVAVAALPVEGAQQIRDRRHDAQRVAVGLDDARVGIAREELPQMRQVIGRRLAEPAAPGLLPLQRFQHALVVSVDRRGIRAVHVLVIGGDLVEGHDRVAHEAEAPERGVLRGQVPRDLVHRLDLRRHADPLRGNEISAALRGLVAAARDRGVDREVGLPEERRAQRGILVEQLLQDRSAAAAEARNEDRFLDRCVEDLGMAAQQIGELEARAEPQQDLAARREAAHQVELRFFVERLQEHAEGLAPIVAAEVR
jgi:hypothetical protein